MVGNKFNTFNKIIRDFLFSRLNKEFLLFLFFLALSSIFWLMLALNETYEREIRIPITMVNIPRNVIITGDSSDTLRVTVRDKGFTLVAYLYGKKIRPIKISFANYSNGNGYGNVPNVDLQKQAYQMLYSSSKITAIKPDHWEFYYNYGLNKRVPVRMLGRVQAMQSYYLSHIDFLPDSVTVYGSKKLLDSIQFVYTERQDIRNFTDTMVRNVRLKEIRGTKFVPSVLKMVLYPDILTEEEVEVPIIAINMPEGKTLRTFPSKVKVKFVVGASLFRKVRSERFIVVADYNDLVEHPSEKCNLYLRQTPHGIKNAQLEVQQVDYLIEQQ